ncbi:MAG: HNH endonuclease, partial [Ignavibacteria bacterium]|nr:HNH endonuclease [Ignavibacteria bacterium]
MDKYQNLKTKLFKEQDGKCFYCGGDFSIEQLDIEHLMPRSLINDDSLRNKVLVCRMCHIKRADRL